MHWCGGGWTWLFFISTNFVLMLLILWTRSHVQGQKCEPDTKRERQKINKVPILKTSEILQFKLKQQSVISREQFGVSFNTSTALSSKLNPAFASLGTEMSYELINPNDNCSCNVQYFYSVCSIHIHTVVSTGSTQGEREKFLCYEAS